MDLWYNALTTSCGIGRVSKALPFICCPTPRRRNLVCIGTTEKKYVRERQYVLSCGIEAYSSHKMATNCVVLKFVLSAKSTEWRGENNLKILFAHFMAKKSQNSSMCF